jgi:hypothetical protein
MANFDPMPRAGIELPRITDGSDGSDGSGNLLHGYGSPEGVVTARVSSIYMDITNPAEPKLYFKTSGTGNTGWV